MYEFTNCSENHELNKKKLIKFKGLVKRLVGGLFGVTPRNIPGFIKHLIEAEEIAKRLSKGPGKRLFMRCFLLFSVTLQTVLGSTNLVVTNTRKITKPHHLGLF